MCLEIQTCDGCCDGGRIGGLGQRSSGPTVAFLVFSPGFRRSACCALLLVFQPDPKRKVPTRVCFLPEKKDRGRDKPYLHPEFANLMSPWKASPWPLDVPKSFLMVITVAKKLEDTMQLVFELVFDPSAMENVDHDAVLLLSSPEAHSTFTYERNGQLFIEMSLMSDHMF